MTIHICKIWPEVIEDNEKPVTQVGENWDQLVAELNAWYLFGRDLEGSLDSRMPLLAQPV